MHEYLISDETGDVVDAVALCSDACHRAYAGDDYNGWDGCHETEHTTYCQSCGVVIPSDDDETCDCQLRNVLVNRFLSDEGNGVSTDTGYSYRPLISALTPPERAGTTNTGTVAGTPRVPLERRERFRSAHPACYHETLWRDDESPNRSSHARGTSGRRGRIRPAERNHRGTTPRRRKPCARRRLRSRRGARTGTRTRAPGDIVKRCYCRACRDRDARRFERIIGRSFTPAERVRLANARMPTAPTWSRRAGGSASEGRRRLTYAHGHRRNMARDTRADTSTP